MHIISKITDPSWWREKCLTDLYFLCRNVLCTLEDPEPGYKDLYKPTHRKLCDFVVRYAKPGHKVLTILPRGWVKSYIITIGFLTQRFLQNLVINFREHWSISSATQDNSEEFLEKFQYNWEHNDLLKAIFRQWIPRDIRTSAKAWKQKLVDFKGNRIKLGSVEKGLTSRHFGGGAINDDLVVWDNSRNAEQLMKTIDFWKLFQSLLMKDSIEIIPGTRYDHDDLYGWILEKFFGMTDKRWEELMKRPMFELHKDNYHYLHFQCWENPEEMRGSTCPTLFPEKKLKEYMVTQGEHFGGQYLGDPMAQSDQVFNPIWWKTKWKLDEIPKQVNTIMTIDPCGKDKSGSDFTGMTICDAGVDKKIYVRFAQRKKVTDLNLIEWIVEVAPFYQPGQIGIEESKYDTLCSLADFHIPQLIRMGRIPPEHIEYVKTIPNILVELKHRGRPKPVRISNLTGWLQSGKMLLAPSGMQDLISELLRFKKTKKDDIIDALAYVLDLLVFPLPTDPEKYIILPDELKMTDQEKEKADWEQYLNEVRMMDPYFIEDIDDY